MILRNPSAPNVAWARLSALTTNALTMRTTVRQLLALTICLILAGMGKAFFI